YPALRKLTERGLIDCTHQAQEKRPDKKVYAIASAGRRAFAEALCQAPGPDNIRSDFLFLAFFSDLAPDALVARAFDERVAWLKTKMETMRRYQNECALSAGEAFTLGYGLAVYETVLGYLETNRDALGATDPAPARETIRGAAK
ncbi:MAG: PadR family transcriptional regulator, partial [Alphaproteobacteria bacterium]